MKKETNPEKPFDLCVVGATPSGIAAAVRAARAGLNVLLTQHTQHVGGMCTNGLGQWDSKSDHRRCPIFGEILDRLETHYRETYGDSSEQHVAAQYRVDRYPPHTDSLHARPVGSYEPSVIEGIFNDLLTAEPNIDVQLGVYPEAADTDDRRIRSVTFREMSGDKRVTATAETFVDATYEGDLAALAGVSYRVGREARAEYDEPHAGMLFTQILFDRNEPALVREGRLNLHPRRSRQGPIDPGSPFSADNRIQAYNTRACVTRDPANRILLEQPPEGFNRAECLHYTRRSLTIQCHINNKNSYNSPILPGENWDYPEGDWATRERITQRHQQFALSWMWFLQNDPAIPAEKREEFRQWGLPKDEFTDNGHLPYEMYVREARRIVGRHVLTENDLSPVEGKMRPRCFEDSIAFTDWYMDSHSCSKDVGTFGPDYPGALGSREYPYDGKLILMEECRPGMIPYRSLVTPDIENLIVPVCASSTHVAFGALRLEPVWIHLGEVAGYAAVQAHAERQSVNRISVAQLQTRLLADGAAIAFFNQHRGAHEDPRYADRQLAVCHGDWDSYDL